MELHAGKHTISCKWVFKVKPLVLDTDHPKYKARLVAKGFRQKHRIDYNDIFSLVVKHISICMVLAMVAHDNMELDQMDVKMTFLHGDLEETIYKHPPEGFIAPGLEHLVCKLKKSLYRLKQSPR